MDMLALGRTFSMDDPDLIQPCRDSTEEHRVQVHIYSSDHVDHARQQAAEAVAARLRRYLNSASGERNNEPDLLDRIDDPHAPPPSQAPDGDNQA